MFYRSRPKICWQRPDGRPSVGAPAQKASSRLVLPQSACGSPMDHRSGSGQRSAASAWRRGLLIGEHRMSGEKKYYLANLPAKTDLRTLAATIKARWICEQAHQQLKEELGLDHFEGRSWQGLHRHALMTMIAYAFLQHRRLAAARRKKKIAAHRLSQPCQPFATPSSNSSRDRHRSGARTAENGCATHCGVSNLPK